MNTGAPYRVMSPPDAAHYGFFDRGLQSGSIKVGWAQAHSGRNFLYTVVPIHRAGSEVFFRWRNCDFMLKFESDKGGWKPFEITTAICIKMLIQKKKKLAPGATEYFLTEKTLI